MKSLRWKVLALVGSGALVLQVTACTPTQVITDLLNALGSIIPTA
jgi:hypothetical protein